jgi:hypothetical protein
MVISVNGRVKRISRYVSFLISLAAVLTPPSPPPAVSDGATEGEGFVSAPELTSDDDVSDGDDKRLL